MERNPVHREMVRKGVRRVRCSYTLHNCHDCGRNYDNPPDVCECGHRLRCNRQAVVGLSVCSLHGGGYGKTKGVKNIRPHPVKESNNILIQEASLVATGREIKRTNTFKSEELATRYEEALSDPELVALRRPLALTSARIQQLLGRVEDGVTTELWTKAMSEFTELRIAMKNDDELEVQKHMTALHEIFDRVEHDYKSWQQVFEALELQRKLSESERKRLLEMRQFITAEEAMKMVRGLTAAIYKIVQDPLQLRRIVYEFTRITGSTSTTGGEGIDNQSGTEQQDRSGSVDQQEFLDTGNTIDNPAD